MADTSPIKRHIWRERLCDDPAISHVCFRVGFILSQFVNIHSGEAWPSINTVAKRLGAGTKTVKRAIKILELAEYLKINRRSARGPTNRYRLTLPYNTDANADNSVQPRGQFDPKTGDTADPQYSRINTENILESTNANQDNSRPLKRSPPAKEHKYKNSRTLQELAIANRIGEGGIDRLSALHPSQAQRLCELQSIGRLSDAYLFEVLHQPFPDEVKEGTAT